MAEQDEPAWDCWSPAELGQRLERVGRPWCIVGGWALDLWHGAPTRPHEDIEFTVLREDVPAFRRHLAGMDFYAVNDGEVMPLSEQDGVPENVAQVWCFDPAKRCWRADMMIEPGTHGLWICKRDPQITRPRSEMVMFDATGLPYLNPSAALLFKAKYCRPKDEADFRAAMPKLAAHEREWLKDTLARLHPGHHWIGMP